ncbi:hypothetical protein SAY87_019483 [Trapa incisa]|uniref:Association with the SNF1 complex (ASC) domain-containing protein n=1 Tax=Trapa incisa TaxID=236973 RepID=A0AAN7K5B9_9MYRT|nr:hypothetical protein SAY87_019483 [Trapa incisa]
MGNANGREEGADGADDHYNGRSNGELASRRSYAPNAEYLPGRVISSDMMASTPPESPGRFRSPLLFAPQVPIAPLVRADSPMFHNQSRQNDSPGIAQTYEEGIPTIINWSHGGKEVTVEGSWDNWRSRKTLQVSVKDHSILLVLPPGIYHYKFIVDGEWRYDPDQPHIDDEMGQTSNILDVHDYVPENLESIEEFETPSSPDSSYSQVLLSEADFGKEPALVPPQLHQTVLGTINSDQAAPSRPQHVVLNHLFMDKGTAPKSAVALGLTHRFQSKYVTVVLYRPFEKVKLP